MIRTEFGTLTFEKGMNSSVSKKVVWKLRLAYTTATKIKTGVLHPGKPSIISLIL